MRAVATVSITTGDGVLTGLQLQNIALIDRLELEFGSGFTVLTGETGAGKSILMGALDALLGGAQGAAGQRLLRDGSERARIEASFQLTSQLRHWLSQADFEPEDELLISREWRHQDGDRWSSRSRLNGTLVNRQQLLSLRPLLIDLTVQGQTQLLAKPGQQRQWLDRLGGSSLAALKFDVVAAWQGWCESSAALEAVEREQQRCEEERAEQEALGGRSRGSQGARAAGTGAGSIGPWRASPGWTSAVVPSSSGWC